MARDFFHETYSKDVYATVIAVCVTILCTFGLLTIYSVTSATNAEAGVSTLADAGKQLLYIGIGVVCAVLLMRTNGLFDKGAWLIWVYWGICIVLMLLVAVVGTNNYGAQRWLNLGFVTVQPSEFLKLALVLVLVKFLGEYQRGERTGWVTIALIGATVIVPLGFLFLTQSDLGTTLICVFALLSVAWVAGVDWRILAAICALGAAGMVFVALNASSFRSDRFNFINPWDDGQNGYGSGFNLIRSMYAIASGGVFGVGIGNSHEKYDYLFAADNDFVFAVICEEMGLVGGLITIACIGVIFFCCVKIADGERDIETKLIVYGCGFLLVFQSVLNIGSTVGVLPTTGKPLPFVSSGGSAVIASFFLLGVILNAVKNENVMRASDKSRDSIEILSGEDVVTVRDVTSRRSRTSSSSRATSTSSTSRTSRERSSSNSYTEIKEPSFLNRKR